MTQKNAQENNQKQLQKSSLTNTNSKPLRFSDRPKEKISKLQWWLPVIALVLQNSGLILAMRYSRMMMSSTGRYSAATVVMTSEFLKLCIALFLRYITP
jgi:hypothetical protein